MHPAGGALFAYSRCKDQEGIRRSNPKEVQFGPDSTLIAFPVLLHQVVAVQANWLRSLP